MPPKRNPVAPAATQPARVAKTKGAKLIAAAVRGASRQRAPTPLRESVSPPPFDVDALGAVIATLPQIQGLNDRFRNLESLINENQHEFRSSLQDAITQFMDWFDALEQHGPLFNSANASSSKIYPAENSTSIPSRTSL